MQNIIIWYLRENSFLKIKKKLFYRFVPPKFQAKLLMEKSLLGVKWCSLKGRQKNNFWGQSNIFRLGFYGKYNFLYFWDYRCSLKWRPTVSRT